eukprot:7389058-Prymnesium_polylepis.1
MPAASRLSSRAAFLFCCDEGFHYDTLPREVFVATLDATEEALSRHSGPFFCGDAFSAADAIWAPVLERYAAQLPCLTDLQPRGGSWPRLTRWYDAMDGVAAYACRLRGDALSWRKVLSSSPWWPAGWPDRGGPDERGDPRGGALLATAGEAAEAFGGASVSPELWAEYAETRPHVASTPGAEAAAALLRNAPAIIRDAEAFCSLREGATREEYERALRAVACLLADREGSELQEATETPTAEALQTPGAAELAAYLDDR